eukprot:6079349-Alexandrium_andersonii.AAC.1
MCSPDPLANVRSPAPNPNWGGRVSRSPNGQNGPLHASESATVGAPSSRKSRHRRRSAKRGASGTRP